MEKEFCANNLSITSFLGLDRKVLASYDWVPSHFEPVTFSGIERFALIAYRFLNCTEERTEDIKEIWPLHRAVSAFHGMLVECFQASWQRSFMQKVASISLFRLKMQNFLFNPVPNYWNMSRARGKSHWIAIQVGKHSVTKATGVWVVPWSKKSQKLCRYTQWNGSWV